MSAFPETRHFSQAFVGRSVGISRISRVKQVSCPTVQPSTSTARLYTKQRVYAVSTTNMPFEAVNLLPTIKQGKILAFSSLLKITIVYFSRKSFNGRSLDGRPPATRTRWSPTGGGERGSVCTEAQRSTSPHGKEKISRNRRTGCLRVRK